MLVIQKAGILGVPPTNAAMAQHTYKNGELRGPGDFVRSLLGQNIRYLQVGEKVYVRKLDIRRGKKGDKIVFNITECDLCNGVDQSSYKAQVVFDFPGDYLATANAVDVQGVISQVLSMDSAPTEEGGSQE